MVKKKNAITLLALVITIVIMLLLAGVAIQMTMGENGLIAKSVQAQKEQAKAELYDTAKLTYMSLNAKALENGQSSPQAELALSTTEFTNKYNVVGDDITDKKGTVIDTKANVLNIIQGTVAGGFSSGTNTGTTTPAEAWPKTVGGVTIAEEDKEKMILKFVVKNDTTINFYGTINTEIDYGNGETGTIITPISKQYNRGEYVLKVKTSKDFLIRGAEDFEIEILQWGKIVESYENNSVEIANVSKIYEPEPDRIPIVYNNGKFTEIPEWLVSKKITSGRMSKFYNCKGITSIPEELFKNNVNATNFDSTFYGCTGLTSIPEGIFKNNVNVTNFESTFYNCKGITSIPEGLFKNNVKMTNFSRTFSSCIGLISIPEGLFKNNVGVSKFVETFKNCSGIINIPEGLFKNNVGVTIFDNTFKDCSGIISIPEGLFKNNVNVTSFNFTFLNCSMLVSIPEGLFNNNVNANFSSTFYACTGLTSIPDRIIEAVKKVKEKGGNVNGMFKFCISASNYNSLPEYMK